MNTICRLFFYIFTTNILIANISAEEAKTINLRQFERHIYSQFGEDGVIQKILETIGTDSKYYVEFGGYDGHALSNTKYLRDHMGWQGLMMDSDHEDLSINLRKEFITAENINELFQKYDVPKNLDLLSIDIDYNDFHIWNNLSNEYRPRLIIVEHNATHLPNEDKVAKYNPYYFWDGTNYYGGSILAFYNLGCKKGYSLVYSESYGVNLFFIRNDLLENCNYKFENVNDVENLYSQPRYNTGPNGGHPQDPHHREYVKSVDLID